MAKISRAKPGRFVLFLGAILFLAAGCRNGRPAADTIIVNAKVYTVNAGQPWAEAVAVREGRILAVGSSEHVLCEKPLATSVEQVDGIAAAARETGKIAAEALMYRHHPQTRKVKELVDSGSLGTVQVIKGAFTFSLQRKSDVRLIPELGGGGNWDVGSYPISYARAVVGEEPLEVFGWQVTGPTGIDETFAGHLKFDRDVLVQFDSSFVIPFHSFMEIVGSEATLNIPRPFARDG